MSLNGINSFKFSEDKTNKTQPRDEPQNIPEEDQVMPSIQAKALACLKIIKPLYPKKK